MGVTDMSNRVACMTTVIIFSLSAPLSADGVEETEQSERTLRLADLEEMALKNNPTVAQADAFRITPSAPSKVTRTDDLRKSSHCPAILSLEATRWSLRVTILRPSSWRSS